MSYAELLKTLQPDVIEDFDEMGSDFYLDKAALCLMGLNWLIHKSDRHCEDEFEDCEMQNDDELSAFE